MIKILIQRACSQIPNLIVWFYIMHYKQAILMAVLVFVLQAILYTLVHPITRKL